MKLEVSFLVSRLLIITSDVLTLTFLLQCASDFTWAKLLLPLTKFVRNHPQILRKHQQSVPIHKLYATPSTISVTLKVERQLLLHNFDPTDKAGKSRNARRANTATKKVIVLFLAF